MKILCSIPIHTKFYVERFRDFGHEILVFNHREYTSGLRRLGYPVPILFKNAIEKTNKKFIEVSKKFNPDFLFSIKGETISQKTIIQIKKNLEIPTAVWLIDDPFYFDKLSRKIAPAYDYVFTNSPKVIPWYKKVGVKNIDTLMFACDPKIHRTLKLSGQDKKRYGSDITFIGNSYPRRIKMLSHLADFDLKIWGPNWSRKIVFLKLMKRGLFKDLTSTFSSDMFEKYMQKGAYDEEMIKVYNASKLTVDAPKSLNMRLFEAIGSGCLTITDKFEEALEDYFEIGKEIVCYNGIQDLREKVKYYIDNPKERERIAKRGQKRAHKDHTAKIRMKQVLSTIK